MKIVDWVLGTTKIGKVYSSTQKFLDGKKQYIGGWASLMSGLCGIALKISSTGLSDLPGLIQSQEWLLIVAGFTAIANAAKGEKIRLGIETVIHGEGGDPNRAGTPAAKAAEAK